MNSSAEPLVPDNVLSVSALNRLARTVLENRLPLLRVEGEISNLTRAASGHLYFTLKDDQAQVRCTMWRNKAQLLRFRPDNGMRIEARAQVTLYEVRGDFQLSIDSLRAAGTGDLFEAFMRLKNRLEAEGLFDVALKRPLPRFPRRIGVVTSPTAAALQDVLAALRRRAPHLEVILYPALVQGEAAPATLVSALRTASARAAADGIDAVLLVRGGGSLEDLWAFNDEHVARTVRDCAVPVVCGVGHETDVTIADFAADLRAATPTGAAELISAGFHEASAQLEQLRSALNNALRNRLYRLEQRLDRAALQLRHPRERLRQSAELSDRLGSRLSTAIGRCIERARSRNDLLAVRLQARKPDLQRAHEHVQRLERLLTRLGAAITDDRDDRVAAIAARLEALAPAAVLARGYSITRDGDGNIVRSSQQLKPGDGIRVQLAEGELGARVETSAP